MGMVLGRGVVVGGTGGGIGGGTGGGLTPGGGGIIEPPKDPRIATISQGAEGSAIPIVYGQARVAGRLFVVAGYSNYLVIAYALSIGPISSIASYTVDGYTAAELAAQGGVDVSTYTGTSGQAINTYLSTAISGYTQRHPYLAYIVLRIAADSKLWGSLPEVVAVVNGRSDVYDPRTAGTAYTANPALIAAHLATSYDAGAWPTASVDWDRVAACANYYDTDISGVDRYFLGAVVNERRSLRDQLQTLLKQVRGYETWREGKWSIWTDGATFPSKNVLTANIATGTDSGKNTTGFTAAAGAAISSSTDEAWQANRSLKVVTPGSGTGEGVTFAATVVAGTQYAVSVRIKADVACTLTDSTAIGAMSVGTEWQRFSGTVTPGGTSITINLVTSGSAQARTFYVDGCQVEAASAATTWDLPSGASGPEIGLNWMVADASDAGTKLRIEESTLPIDQVPDLVRVRYTDSSREWEFAEQRFPLAGIPGGSSRELEISAPWITAAGVAARLAEETYNERQMVRRLRLTTFRDETPLERGRTITVDGVLGLSSSTWRVADISPKPDGTTVLELAETYSTSVAVGLLDSRSTPDVPRSSDTPSSPTNTTLAVRSTSVGGSTSYEIAAAWDPSPSSNVVGYRVEKYVSSIRTTVCVTLRNVTSCIIPVTTPGVSHAVYIYAVNQAGDESTPDSNSVTPGSTVTASLGASYHYKTRRASLIKAASGEEYDLWFATVAWTVSDSGNQLDHLDVLKNSFKIAELPKSATLCYIGTSGYSYFGDDGTDSNWIASGYRAGDSIVIRGVLKDGRTVDLNMGTATSWGDVAPTGQLTSDGDLISVADAANGRLREAVRSSPTTYKSPVYGSSGWSYEQIIPTSNAGSILLVDSNGKATSIGALPTNKVAAMPWHTGSAWAYAKFNAGVATINNAASYVDVTHGVTFSGTGYAAVATSQGTVEALRVQVTSATVIRIERAGTSGSLDVFWFVGGS